MSTSQQSWSSALVDLAVLVLVGVLAWTGRIGTELVAGIVFGLVSGRFGIAAGKQQAAQAAQAAAPASASLPATETKPPASPVVPDGATLALLLAVGQLLARAKSLPLVVLVLALLGGGCGCIGLTPARTVDERCEGYSSAFIAWGGIAAGAGGMSGVGALAGSATEDRTARIVLATTSAIVGAIGATSVYVASSYARRYSEVCGDRSEQAPPSSDAGASMPSDAGASSTIGDSANDSAG